MRKTKKTGGREKTIKELQIRLNELYAERNAEIESIVIPKLRRKWVGKCLKRYWSDTKRVSYIRILEIINSSSARVFAFDFPDLVRGVNNAESIGFFRKWRAVNESEFFAKLNGVLAKSRTDAGG